ncbi:MAG: CCA tRNA nucleotidyltransferase [Eubacteriales bacterium]|nr:CCA tRNA nucleotidyltransferase [Eubacteriales bacterium]
MEIKMPATVKMVLDTLHANGYEAYAVGGCVRDSILGRRPDDWDITTSALPEQVKAIFGRTVDTGIQHGTVTVLVGGKAHEVTTYRLDGEYLDGRHPEDVTFVSNLEEDLKRRDFTINAMAYNEEEGLIDLFGGVEDLERKVIRCVGDPMQRFSEDALRIMRAVRFSAQLSFGIDPDTIAGIIRLAPTLEKVSAERICTELTKMLLSEHPNYLKVAYEAGITRIVLPEFDAMMQTPQNHPRHMANVGEHTLMSMQAVKNDRVLRYTMLFHDIGKPLCRTTDEVGIDHFRGHNEISADMAGQIMRRLKMDNDTIKKVKTLVYWHDWMGEATPKSVRRLIHHVGADLFPLLMQVKNADTMAKSERYRVEELQYNILVSRIGDDILRENQCLTLKDLAVNGKDLMELGVQKGPGLGEILQMLLEEVLEVPEKNDRDLLLDIVRSHLEL